jgi:hypothetical protein
MSSYVLKCNGGAVNLNVHFGFMLFWQPDCALTWVLMLHLETNVYI